MKRTFLLLALLAGCAEPPPPPGYYVVVMERDDCHVYGSCGTQTTLDAVDARRDAATAELPVEEHRTKPRAGTPAAFSDHPAVQEPVGKEPERATAIEVAPGGATVVEHGGTKPMTRQEAESLTKRCSTRATRWAREQCMAGR